MGLELSSLEAMVVDKMGVAEGDPKNWTEVLNFIKSDTIPNSFWVAEGYLLSGKVVGIDRCYARRPMFRNSCEHQFKPKRSWEVSAVSWTRWDGLLQVMCEATCLESWATFLD